MGYNQIVAYFTDWPDNFSELEKEIKDWLQGKEIEYHEHPYDPNAKLFRIHWDEWFIRFYYEFNGEVERRAEGIASKNENHPKASLIAKASKRLRMLGKNEEEPDHLNEYIDAMDFMENLPGAILYDCGKEEIID